MNKVKFTGWILATHEPVRTGWYQVIGTFRDSQRGKKGIVWRYWNGKEWLWKSIDNGEMCLAGIFTNDKWRGISKQDHTK